MLPLPHPSHLTDAPVPSAHRLTIPPLTPMPASAAVPNRPAAGGRARGPSAAYSRRNYTRSWHCGPGRPRKTGGWRRTSGWRLRPSGACGQGRVVLHVVQGRHRAGAVAERRMRRHILNAPPHIQTSRRRSRSPRRYSCPVRAGMVPPSLPPPYMLQPPVGQMRENKYGSKGFLSLDSSLMRRCQGILSPDCPLLFQGSKAYDSAHIHTPFATDT
jgi:hypothetical protein